MESQQSVLKVTEGATALDINHVEANKVEENREQINDSSFSDISIENATYLQNTETVSGTDEHFHNEDNITNFEVDSIELASPQLFSGNEETNSLDQKQEEEKEPRIFENFETKEPEMFEEKDNEEDFEIPAFLRRQKN